MKTPLHRIILCLAALCLITSGCNDRSGSLRVKNFSVLYGNVDLARVKNSTGWTPVDHTAFIDIPKARIDRYNPVWFRGEVDCDDPSRYAGISLGRTLDTDSVYINGILVGSKTIEHAVEWYIVSLYDIPRGVLSKGANTVYIRIGMIGTKRRAFTSDILLLTRAQLEAARFWSNVFGLQMTIGIIIVLVVLLVIQLVNYLVDRKQKLRLIVCYGCLTYLSGLVAMFIPNNNFQSMWTIGWASGPAVIIFMVLLFQGIYGIFFSSQNRIVIPLLAFCSLAVLASGYLVHRGLISGTTYFAVSVLLSLPPMMASLPYLAYLISRLQKIRPNRFKAVFTACGFIFTATMVIWMAVQMVVQFTDFERILLVLMLIYVILVIIYDAYASKSARARLSALYHTISAPKQAKPNHPTITGSSEEKLERVIAFINENYASDISREGLAAAIDINPSYLSSLFNAYTGKKINEYINLLRVKDAAHQLETSDASITDIAFSVGFESLSTFIRAFKNEMETTPKEFRNRIKNG